MPDPSAAAQSICASDIGWRSAVQAPRRVSRTVPAAGGGGESSAGRRQGARGHRPLPL